MPIIEEYKYLGITLDNRLNLINHIKQLKTKIMKRTILIQRILGNFSIRTRIIMWQSLIRSIIDYSKETSLIKNK